MSRELIQEFRDFCARRRPNETFSYVSRSNCAVAQFAASKGTTWEDAVSPLGDWRTIDYIASEVDRPRTFGKLVKALDARLSAHR